MIRSVYGAENAQYYSSDQTTQNQNAGNNPLSAVQSAQTPNVSRTGHTAGTFRQFDHISMTEEAPNQSHWLHRITGQIVDHGLALRQGIGLRLSPGQLIEHIIARPGVTDINHTDDNGTTRLIHAARYGHQREFGECLKVLNVDVDHADVHGNTALTVAARHGRHDMVKALVNIPETDVNHANKRGDTALIRAASNGYFHVVKTLIRQPDIDLDFRNNQGNTAIVEAAKSNHHGIVNALVDAGAAL